MPDKHIIIGIVIGALMFLTGVDIIPILLLVGASILIDIDHFFYYIFRFKSCNIFEMNRYFRSDCHLEDKKNPLPILIFHNLETLLILALIAIPFPIIWYVIIGIQIHLLIDLAVMPTQRYPPIIKLSLIAVLNSNKRRANNL